jgi:hypothetical protein
MKKLVISLMAACALAAAVPVAAHPYDRGGSSDSRRGGWGRGDRDDGAYQNYSQELRRLADWAERGYSEGMFNSRSARNFLRESSYLQQLLQSYYSNDRFLDGRERQYLDNRISNLRNLMQSYYDAARSQQGRGRGRYGDRGYPNSGRY